MRVMTRVRVMRVTVLKKRRRRRERRNRQTLYPQTA
jgi:hypothetical protein